MSYVKITFLLMMIGCHGALDFDRITDPVDLPAHIPQALCLEVNDTYVYAPVYIFEDLTSGYIYNSTEGEIISTWYADTLIVEPYQALAEIIGGVACSQSLMILDDYYVIGHVDTPTPPDDQLWIMGEIASNPDPIGLAVTW